MDKLLAHLGRIVIGVILGVFTLGITLSLIIGPTIGVGIISGIFGVIGYYSYLLYVESN